MKALLRAGVAAPIVYFATQIVAIALNPSFSIATQQPSELGVATAHWPIIANAGFMATGVGFILGAAGLFAGLRANGGNIILAVLTALSLAMLGFAELMSGFFPLPDPLHYAFGLYVAGIVFPLFGALAFRSGGLVRWLCLASFLICVGIFAAASFGGLANAENAGLFSRAISIVLFGTIALLCWALARPLKGAG